MAKVKIQGNASGTGVVTLTAPNTNTDRTITLPDVTSTLATSENFLSTGIDDNATAVKLTVSDAGINVNGALTTLAIKEADSGNVGIGTVNPDQPLHIHSASGDSGIKLTTGSSGESTVDGFRLYFSGTGEVKFRNFENSDLNFYTNNLSRLRIDSSGNVGIGVVPETWSGYTALQIGNEGSIAAKDGYTNIGQNYYFNGGYKYITQDVASFYQAGAGKHQFFVAPSGTADAAIPWTTGFEVLNDGKASAKNGLLFGSDTAAANALDDYEEGTWTPAITRDSTAPTLSSYTEQTGSYIKIGRTVWVTCNLRMDAITGGGGGWQISGLPFSADKTAFPFMNVISGYNYVNGTDRTTAYGEVCRWQFNDNTKASEYSLTKNTTHTSSVFRKGFTGTYQAV